jgi:hypothetical protein
VDKKKHGAASGRTLEDFVRAKRRSNCVVCKLSPEVLAQIKTARDKRIARDIVVEWLEKDHRVKISPDELTSHVNARHE